MRELPRLLVILDEVEGGHDVLTIARGALAAGARMLLYRVPGKRVCDYIEVAREVASLAASYDALFLTHDRLDVALALGADGTHLPGYGMCGKDARRVFGQGKILGKSLHVVSEFEDREQAVALTYATLSPVYLTSSKPGYGPALGVGVLGEAAKLAPEVKVFALGGVTPRRVGACLDAGAYGVAVMGGISHADDPYLATRAYLDALSLV